jgi:hypothetical protein
VRLHQENVDAGRSFGGAAGLYDRLRYTASDQVLAWLLSGHERGQVLDLASGTGQIARRLTRDFTGQEEERPLCCRAGSQSEAVRPRRLAPAVLPGRPARSFWAKGHRTWRPTREPLVAELGHPGLAQPDTHLRDVVLVNESSAMDPADDCHCFEYVPGAGGDAADRSSDRVVGQVLPQGKTVVMTGVGASLPIPGEQVRCWSSGGHGTGCLPGFIMGKIEAGPAGTEASCAGNRCRNLLVGGFHS